MADKNNIDYQLSMVTTPEDPSKSPIPSQTEIIRRRQTRKNGTLLRHVMLFTFVVFLSAAAYLAVSRYMVESVQIVGESMVPTLQQNSHYILNRMAFNKIKPQHGDIVVIRDPEDNGFSVKRVIATEGESV